MNDSSRPENDAPRNGQGANKYSELPERVRPEDLIETVDVTSHTVGGDDETRARERMLPYSAAL